MSIVDPLTCVFLVYNILTKRIDFGRNDGESKKNLKSRVLQHKFEEFSKSNFSKNVEYKSFKTKFHLIVEHLQKLGKRNGEAKKELLETFSLENWEALGEKHQQQHNLFDCEGCFKSTKLKGALSNHVN